MRWSSKLGQSRARPTGEHELGLSAALAPTAAACRNPARRRSLPLSAPFGVSMPISAATTPRNCGQVTTQGTSGRGTGGSGRRVEGTFKRGIQAALQA